MIEARWGTHNTASNYALPMCRKQIPQLLTCDEVTVQLVLMKVRSILRTPRNAARRECEVMMLRDVA